MPTGIPLEYFQKHCQTAATSTAQGTNVASGNQKVKGKKTKCKTDGCKNQVKARGYCRRCDPNYGNCKAPDCKNQVYARGRCKKHDKMHGEKKKG